ncbi:hypothetical protein [Salipiger mangrovisoli]|uniref:Lipoprotein n=1 Tax=Salipiger mangrovisoli TaxID=2865933 RepID=A0ABR9WWG1_9RHOB|nr:hypothetical protein [Salipiger mangrovisoli]MBE9635611.1 hypothetical protein [Salipiger mangrovisoli]
MLFPRTASILAAIALVSACDETASPTAGTPMAPAPGAPPFIETMAPEVSNAAVSSCQTALAAQTSGGVTVVGSETSEAATAIYMRVGANGAPWRCLVAADGSGPEVMFMGDEGAA